MAEGVEGLSERQERAARHRVAGTHAGRPGHRADAGATQPRSNALERSRDGKGGRHRCFVGREDLARSRPRSTPLAQL